LMWRKRLLDVEEKVVEVWRKRWLYEGF
jgi:hypothetical protein